MDIIYEAPKRPSSPQPKKEEKIVEKKKKEEKKEEPAPKILDEPEERPWVTK